MKRKYQLENLCCANCASKMEFGIAKLKNIEDVNINFLTQKMDVELSENADIELVEKEIEKVVKKIDCDVELLHITQKK